MPRYTVLTVLCPKVSCSSCLLRVPEGLFETKTLFPLSPSTGVGQGKRGRHSYTKVLHNIGVTVVFRGSYSYFSVT